MRSALRWSVLLGLAVLVVSLAWSAVALLSLRDDLERAEAALRGAADAEDLADAEQALAAADVDLRRARGRLGAPGPVVATWVPVLGRTPRAARALVVAGAETTRQARAVLAVADSGLVSDGTVDLAALDRLRAALATAGRATRGPVEDLLDAPTGLVPGVLSSAVREARERLREVPGSLTAGAGAVDAVAAVGGRDGPRRLLVVLENNAELRGSGGLVSVFAEVSLDDGRLEVGSFSDVDGVAASRGDLLRQVDAPADYRALWGRYRADTTLWKNVNMSAELPAASAVLAGLAEASLGRRPDAVLWIDVRTIAAVIGATGDATLPDGTVLTEQSTVPELLSKAYAAVADTGREQGLRRARLRAAADVFVDRLTTGAPDAARLAPALARSVQGRHLALWSARPDEQRAIERAGLAGDLDGSAEGDLVSASVNNLGDGADDGNKLDFYARRQVTVTVELSADTALVRQEVVLRNTAPARGLPGYVAGLRSPGTSNNLVTFALPSAAEQVAFTRGGTGLLAAPRDEGRHAVLQDVVSLAPGASATWSIAYRLPLRDGRYDLRLVPQALAVDAGLSVRVTAADGVPLYAVDDGRLLRDGLEASRPFGRVTELSVTTQAPGLWTRARDRLARFWNEPVRLP